MKRTFAILISVFTFCAAIQAETFEIDENYPFFDSIEASNSFQVTVKRGDVYSVHLVLDKRIENFTGVHLQGGTLVLGINEKEYTKDKVKNLFKQKDMSTLVLMATVYVPEDAEFKSIKLKNTATLSSEISFDVKNSLSIEATETSSAKCLDINAGSLTIMTEKKASVTATADSPKTRIVSKNSSNVELSLQGKSLEIDNDNFSELKMSGNVTEVKIKSSGFSKLSLKTVTDRLMVNAKGNAEIDASEADVDDVEVDLNSSECWVSPKKSLVMTLASNAKLYFDGKPLLTVKKIANSTVMPASESKNKNRK